MKRLSFDDLSEIRNLRLSGVPVKHIAGDWGISRQTVYDSLMKYARAFRGKYNPKPPYFWNDESLEIDERVKAWQRLDAIRVVAKLKTSGKLKYPTNCQKCGKYYKKIHAHHPDYSKPYIVDFLCPSCHQKEHSDLREVFMESF